MSRTRTWGCGGIIVVSQSSFSSARSTGHVPSCCTATNTKGLVALHSPEWIVQLRVQDPDL